MAEEGVGEFVEEKEREGVGNRGGRDIINSGFWAEFELFPGAEGEIGVVRGELREESSGGG